jgi:hypothetical protein
MGFISDTLFGTEKKYKADPLAGDINSAAKAGLGYAKAGGAALNNVYSQDPSAVVQSQIGMENKLARGASDDAIRRTRQLITQRGIGNSSIGLGQEVNQNKMLYDKVAANNASGISRLRDMQIENGQGQMNAGSGLFQLKSSQGPIQMQDIKQRTGGYGELLVAGGKAYASSGASTGK